MAGLSRGAAGQECPSGEARVTGGESVVAGERASWGDRSIKTKWRLLCVCVCVSLGPHPQHTKVPRLGVKSML